MGWGQIHYKGNWKEWATENQDFFSPEMATIETHVPMGCFYMALRLNDFDGDKSITRAIGRGGP
jgi:hypothetical protein